MQVMTVMPRMTDREQHTMTNFLQREGENAQKHKQGGQKNEQGKPLKMQLDVKK
jgi:hypothetical protein